MNVQNLSKYLLTLDNILIFTHESPDGDAINSAFALQKAFTIIGKKADLFFLEEVPKKYQKYKNANTFIKCKDESKSYSFYIAVDCGNFERLDTFCKGSKLDKPLINIDHHQDNTKFGDISFIDKEASSTAEIIMDILTADNTWVVSKEVADYILSGILLDTGGLRFSNTDAKVLRKIATLIELGANYNEIVNENYFTKPLPLIKLEAETVLNLLKIEVNGKFAYAYIDENTLQKYGIKYKDTEGLIDYIRTIDGLVITALISKIENGFKISMRSIDQKFPVDGIAHELSGGGHKLAAGAKIKNRTFNEAIEIILEKVKTVLGE